MKVFSTPVAFLKMSSPRPSKPPRCLVPGRYAVRKRIGQGAYGSVYRATQVPTGVDVAIKNIAPFDHKLTCLRTLREIELLRHFDHENIVLLVEVTDAVGDRSASEVILVLEFMPIDLNVVIRTQELSDEQCQCFTYQLLRGLAFVHSAGIIHRDIKPANLLVNDQCDLKICNFGLARYDLSTGECEGFMTESVATRWYRDPEILLSFSQYTQAIDIWSAGCVLAEMLGRRSLFRGHGYQGQLMEIFRILGSITEGDNETIKSRRAREYIESLPKQIGIPWHAQFPRATALSLEFLKLTLMFDPEKRPTAAEALKHPYLVDYHDPDDEPFASRLADDILSFERAGRKPDHDDVRSRWHRFRPFLCGTHTRRRTAADEIGRDAKFFSERCRSTRTPCHGSSR